MKDLYKVIIIILLGNYIMIPMMSYSLLMKWYLLIIFNLFWLSALIIAIDSYKNVDEEPIILEIIDDDPIIIEESELIIDVDAELKYENPLIEKICDYCGIINEIYANICVCCGDQGLILDIQ